MGESKGQVGVAEVRRKMALAGALLMTVGFFTGIWTAVTATGMISVPIPHLALAAHLNGLLGGMWLLAVSFSIEFLSYTEKQIKKLYWLILIPTWGNWIITLLASFLGVKGLTYGSGASNNVIAFLLQLFVVLPALVGSGFWVRGFFYEKLA